MLSVLWDTFSDYCLEVHVLQGFYKKFVRQWGYCPPKTFTLFLEKKREKRICPIIYIMFLILTSLRAHVYQTFLSFTGLIFVNLHFFTIKWIELLEEMLLFETYFRTSWKWQEEHSKTARESKMSVVPRWDVFHLF